MRRRQRRDAREAAPRAPLGEPARCTGRRHREGRTAGRESARALRAAESPGHARRDGPRSRAHLRRSETSTACAGVPPEVGPSTRMLDPRVHSSPSIRLQVPTSEHSSATERTHTPHPARPARSTTTHTHYGCSTPIRRACTDSRRHATGTPHHASSDPPARPKSTAEPQDPATPYGLHTDPTSRRKRRNVWLADARAASVSLSRKASRPGGSRSGKEGKFR